MKPSQTYYKKWGKGQKIPLRFTKSGDRKIEEAYARHFVAPGVGRKKRPPADEAGEVTIEAGQTVGD